MKKRYFFLFTTITILLTFCAASAGVFVGVNLPQLRNMAGLPQIGNSDVNINVLNEDSPIIDVAEKTSPSVVSIAITKDQPVYETDYDSLFGLPQRRQVGTEEQQVGSGSGFIITTDGTIITNKHVVSDEDAHYTVILNDGSEFSAKVLGRDPLLDIAVVKIDPAGKALTALSIGDSDKIKVGQNVVAIGNSLGRFSNTVSSGIISGLGRSIIASDGSGFSERLDGVLQTDASINPGNSGGPLLDIGGNVIGVNVAIAAEAENVGFAIPINLVLPVIDSVKQFGEIRRPVLGVRYQQVTPAIAKEFDLPVDYGARIITGPNGEPAIAKDSAAAVAGLKAEDIIIAINGVQLKTTTLQLEIQKYKVDEKIEVKFMRDKQEQTVTVTLKNLTVTN